MNNAKSITDQLIQTREKYISTIRAELLGPGSEFSVTDPEHELISGRPTQRYCVGILYPQNSTVETKDGEALNPEDEEEYEDVLEEVSSDSGNDQKTHEKNDTDDTETDEDFDDQVNMSKQYMPSSMGITCIAEGDSDSLTCNISFATYRKAKQEDCFVPPVIKDGQPVPIPDSLKDIMRYDNSKNVICLIKKIENEDFSKDLDNEFRKRVQGH